MRSWFDATASGLFCRNKVGDIRWILHPSAAWINPALRHANSSGHPSSATRSTCRPGTTAGGGIRAIEQQSSSDQETRSSTAALPLYCTSAPLVVFGYGLATLLASLLAGAFWAAFGPPVTFAAGAAFSAVALGGLLAWQMRYANAAANK
jgi:hypothetical protein